MRLIINEKQKDNIAKYLYDISKICFAVAVIGPFAKPENMDSFIIVEGVVATILSFTFATLIDSKKY